MIRTKQIRLDDNIDWKNLLKQSNTASFFQQKEWLSLWLKHFPAEELILGVFENEELIGIVPFIKKDNTVQFMGIASVLGGELVSDYGDIIALKGREKEVWEAVMNIETMKQFNNLTMELNFVREGSPGLGILRQMGGKVEEVDVAPYIDLPKTWDEYLGGLSRHDRHELRRKMRKAWEAGLKPVKYRGEAELKERFFQLMAVSGEEKRKFLSDEMKNYFREIIGAFWDRKMLEMNFLEREGKVIAATLSFYFQDQVLLYNSGFDPEDAGLSAGLVLSAMNIKEAIEKGKTVYDFLRGGERYKYDLGGKERKLYKVTF